MTATWRKDNPERSRVQQREYSRRYKEKHPEVILWRSAKRRARDNNLDFNLEVSDIVIPVVCPVLGIPLFPSIGKKSNNSPELDRIDTTKGYIKGNVAVISSKANTCKRDLTIEEIGALFNYVSGLAAGPT